jgi:LuxR family maltose regulon positive regulatory protein
MIRNQEQTTLIRIYLAQGKPALALADLPALREEAQQTQRWHHVLELQLLESLAYQMLQEEDKALACLLKAVHIAEAEGYMRIFLDEGPPMANLLAKLRQQEKTASASYLDRLLSAFQHNPLLMLSESKIRKETSTSTTHKSLLEPLSEREMEVLHLLGEGRSNQEIARTLVLSPNTVKGYVSTILAKLQASNRTQAVMRAHDLGLLTHIS